MFSVLTFPNLQDWWKELTPPSNLNYQNSHRLSWPKALPLVFLKLRSILLGKTSIVSFWNNHWAIYVLRWRHVWTSITERWYITVKGSLKPLKENEKLVTIFTASTWEIKTLRTTDRTWRFCLLEKTQDKGLFVIPWRLSGKESACWCRRQGVRSLGWEDSLKKEMATHSRILAWKIPRTEEPAGLQSLGSRKSKTRLRDQTNNKGLFTATLKGVIAYGSQCQVHDLQRRRFHSGTKNALSHSQLCAAEILLKWKDRESFWHTHEKWVERVPTMVDLSRALYTFSIGY